MRTHPCAGCDIVDRVPLSRAPGRHAAEPGPVLHAWTELTRLVLPVSCAGCGADDVPLCRVCRAAMPVGASRVRDLTATGAPPVWAAGPYDQALRRVLVQVKDEGRHDLVPVLAACAARAARAALEETWTASDEARAAFGRTGAGGRAAVLVVPVPSSRAAVRRRGADVVAQTARRVAVTLRRRRMPVVAVAALRQRRGVRDQAALNAAERVGNVAAALRVRPATAVSGRVVLLLDDVVTTGATLAAASTAVQAAGGTVLGAATVAATARRRPSS